MATFDSEVSDQLAAPGQEPDYYYVRDSGSIAAHHWDYLRDRATHALCGTSYQGSIVFEGASRPRSVCRKCQAALPAYEAKWWRDVAAALSEKLHDLNQQVVRSRAESNGLAIRTNASDYPFPASSGTSSPPHYFVHDAASGAAHHWSYLDENASTALCGHEYGESIIFEGAKRPESVCEKCDEKVAIFDAQWWREYAQTVERSRRSYQSRSDIAFNELSKLRTEYQELAKRHESYVQSIAKSDGPSSPSQPNSLERDPLLALLQ